MDKTQTQTTHVVVIGCGFGGLEAVKTLARQPSIRITLIDKTNHHLFQPLLYQVATAGLSAPAIAEPIRHLFRKHANVTVLLATVVGIDAAAKTVALQSGASLSFDHLIVAAGATHSYFGHGDWARHALGLKTLEDAFAIRKRLLLAYEQAETCDDPAEVDALLTSVVIGAGPTGVEMAGTMAEIAHHTLPGEFRRIDPARARVILLEGGPRVLAAYDAGQSASALAQLQRLGVEVRLNTRVVGVSASGVQCEVLAGLTPELQDIPARTLIWAAGVAASPLGQALAQTTAVALDRAGRVLVEPDLSVAGHPCINVVGDLASAKSYAYGAEPIAVPSVSPSAKQMGRLAARNILQRLEGRPTAAFKYLDYGALATIGRKSAIAEVDVPLLGKVRFGGYFAWSFWLLVHIFFLIGFRNRLVVLLDWAWAYLTFERHARIVVGETNNAAVGDESSAAQKPIV
jgi:NADH:ubiquinone reductase (H+-translocating)